LSPVSSRDYAHGCSGCAAQRRAPSAWDSAADDFRERTAFFPGEPARLVRRIFGAAGNQSMTRQAKAVLYCLSQYLKSRPERRLKLKQIHKKRTGQDLNKANLWKHLNLSSEPSLSTSMIYLEFLFAERAILPGSRKLGLFVYADPSLFKPLKK
jgi:hypothetical protein